VKTIQRSSAYRAGLLATAFILGLQVFNGAACYRLSLGFHLAALGLVVVAFLPGIASLFSRNPLRAVGAALCFAPWLAFAYYTDCVLPPKGPASSMTYLAVVVYGLPSAALGAWATAPLLAALRVRVGDA
jgi:hypothetical protein